MREPVNPTEEDTPRGYRSERGPFKVNADPEISPPAPREVVNLEKAADGFAHEPLAEKYGEETARQKIGEMV